MIFIRIVITILLLATFSCHSSRERKIVQREGKADIFLVEETDPEMVEAIAQAQRSVPEFLTALKSPKKNQSGFAVKYPFREPEYVEHMWVTELSYNDSVLRGVLNNEPKDLRNFKAGQQVEVSPAKISDWMNVEDGRLVGGYSLRLLFRKYTPEEKRAFEQSLGFKVD